MKIGEVSMSNKANKLTIYLIKPEYTEFSDIAKDGLETHEIDAGTFYMLPSNVRPPGWIGEFFGTALPALNLRVASARGLFLTRAEHNGVQRVFGITFGSGRFLMRDGVIEERFGLRVTLNSVAENSLRSIDKVSLGATAKHSREQISRSGGADSFGIDIEQDLLSAATGRSKVEKFGRVVSGKDALAISAKFDVTDVAQLLKTCLVQYSVEDYKKDFDWIDHIKDTRDKKLIEDLDAVLIDKINNGDLDRVWLVPPEIIDWADVKGFRYVRRKRADLEADLAILELVDAIGKQAVTVEDLKGAKIHLVSAKSDDVTSSWLAYRCIYAEIEWDERFFILNSGKWYEVDKDFTEIVKKDFATTKATDLAFLAYLPEHLNEAGYNQELSASLDGSCCMDAKNIPHGGGKSSIEFCDVLTVDNKLIHVKRYSGSAQLSHLFAQGVNSAEVFASDSIFRGKLNERLPHRNKLPDPDVRPTTTEYEIVFGIISKSAKDLDIPFFSKVSLKNAKSRLSGLGYEVSIKKIQTEMGERGEDVIDDADI